MPIFTPLGTEIGFLPIRDIFFCLRNLRLQSRIAYVLPRWGAAGCAPTKLAGLPNFAEKLAARPGLARGAAAHQTFRRGESADAESADDGLDCHRFFEVSRWKRRPASADSA